MQPESRRLDSVPAPPPRRPGPLTVASRKALAVFKEYLPMLLVVAGLVALSVWAYWADSHGYGGGSGP